MECQDIPMWESTMEFKPYVRTENELLTIKANTKEELIMNGRIYDWLACNSDKVEITHLNLNDNTIEGIRVVGKNAFSVQYHPEASPGPHDSRYLFDFFIEMMEQEK